MGDRIRRAPDVLGATAEEVMGSLREDVALAFKRCNQLERELAAAAKLLAERDAQIERIRKLVEALKAADRIWRNEYVIWHVAGGPNECPHGYAAGIHCRLCDRTTVVVALAAEGVD